jgi:PAS domain S-box-containing protein
MVRLWESDFLTRTFGIKRMSKTELGLRRVGPAVWRYGLSVLLVALGTAATMPLRIYGVRTSLFFPAVLLSTWYGGTGPGLLAVLLSTLSINFFFTEPFLQFQFGVQDIPTTAAFLLSASIISSWSAARTRTENRLRDNEQRWHGLTEALPQLVWGATSDGACDYFSTQWTDHTGVPETELLGWQWMKVLHPDDREPTREFWTDSVAGRAPYDVEYRVQRKDGVYRWFKTRGVPIRDDEGKIEKWFGTCTDITDHKQAEASLRQSESELRKTRDELEDKVGERTAELNRSNEALRASEQVARGQVEALTQSLDVLATAPDPENFIGQMLSAMARLLNAQSVVLWLFDKSTDSLLLRSAWEDESLPGPDPEHPFIKDPLMWKQNPVMQELIFTGAPVVCDDIETDPRVSGDWADYLKRRRTKRFLAVPMFIGGEIKGFVGIRHFHGGSYRPEEIELTQALAHQVMLALQLNEFAEQGHRAAVFEERNRMARDIHDTLAQGFTGVIVQVEAAEDALSRGWRKEADQHLQRVAELARRSLNEARRSVHALRPQALEDHNFWDALKGIIKNTTVGTALRIKFETLGEVPDLPRPWQENLLHIGQEALTNTLKYGHAHYFETRLTYKAKKLRLELRDDGTGFSAKEGHDGMGLTGMRERVEQMGGELEIASARGKGTKITVLLPCNGESIL